ncbi:MAG: serine hydrolase domain-containing protein [Chloroflexota bacterium]
MQTNDPQPTPAADQNPPQLDIERLEADIEHRMATSHVPALALAIVTPQTTIYANGFGILSVDETDMLTTPNTLFRIASFTKPLVGTMIMRLQASGRLSIDQPVTELVPALRFQNEAYSQQITLRHLLSHTAGLRPTGVSGDNRTENVLAHLVTTELPHWPFFAPPGTLHAYSNLGLCVAGYVAEVLTQTPFEQLMKDEIFTPLGMYQTTFDPFMAMTFRVAQAHNLLSDGHLAVQRPLVHNAAFTPAGGAFSTVLDFVHFVQLRLNRGSVNGQVFLPTELIDMMHHTDRLIP